MRDGPARLEVPSGRDDEERALDVAVVVPQFRRGSGGHHTVADLIRGLEARGHRISLWLEDEEGRHADESDSETTRLFREFFGAVEARLSRRFDAFRGADVAVATGWQTVARVLSLPGLTARAYLVQDHEPEFYATSAERLWAEWTYRQGLHCICASPWLAELVGTRYGATVASFDLGVNHAQYTVRQTRRRDDLVLVYARAVTPRRGVPLALLAMHELCHRRSHVDIALFGESRPTHAAFRHTHLGVLDPDALADVYASATAGVVLSLTNPSLVTTEMLACGLPVVDVRSESMMASFGEDGPVVLAEPDPLSICTAVERLLDDRILREDRTMVGVDFTVRRTWDRAASQVEAGLREALRLRFGQAC